MPKITYDKGLTTTVSDNILKTGRFSGSSISITNIPTGYRDLELHILNPLVSSDNTHNGIK